MVIPALDLVVVHRFDNDPPRRDAATVTEWADHGNVRVTRRVSGLPHDSVVDVSRLITLDKQMLTENVGRLPAQSLRDVEAGIKLVLAL